VAAGSTRWSGGTIGGTWTLATGATLTGENGNNKYVSGDTTVLTNEGTIDWHTSQQLWLDSGATLVNDGTLQLGDSEIRHYAGASPTFINNGLLVKDAGAGTGAVRNLPNVVNNGTIDVQTGTLWLPDNWTNDGVLQGTGAFREIGTLTNQGVVDAGGATPGTLALDGSFSQAASGTFHVDVGGLGQTDLFTVSGAAGLSGTLEIACFAACSFTTGDTFTILDATTGLGGTFDSVVLNGFATGSFDVIYDLTQHDVRLLVTSDITAAVPEPGTWGLLIAGLGTIGFLTRRRRPGIGR
jgi:hypothetical protein